MIKVTLGQLADCGTQIIGDQRIPGALDQLLAMRLPVKTAWRLKDIVAAITPKFERFAKERNDLYIKHGTPNPENPEEYRLEDQDQVNAFNRDFVELRDIVIEISGEPLKISDFHSSTALSPADMMKLDWLLADNEVTTIGYDELDAETVEEAEAPSTPATSEENILDLDGGHVEAEAKATAMGLDG